MFQIHFHEQQPSTNTLEYDYLYYQDKGVRKRIYRKTRNKNEEKLSYLRKAFTINIVHHHGARIHARRSRRTTVIHTITHTQDHQALLKAKYRPRVAAASCTQKNTRAPCDLDL